MIRESLKGHHLDQRWIQLEFIYWFFAHHFNFIPKQVDELPYDRMIYMFEFEKEMKKKESEAFKK